MNNEPHNQFIKWLDEPYDTYSQEELDKLWEEFITVVLPNHMRKESNDNTEVR